MDGRPPDDPVARALDTPRTEGAADRLAALAVALAYLALLLATTDDLGYARDEGFYFAAAESYERWLGLLFSDPARALAERDAFWRVNHEHPSLMKSLFAVSHHVLYERRRLFSWEGTSYRFAGMAVSSLGIGVTYLWGVRARGRLAGVVAAGSLALMPRFLYHAHLACFDAPVVATWTLCAYAYWRALARGGVRAALVTGLLFGLALETKHNAWFLPVVCALHAALCATRAVGGPERRVLVRRGLASLAAMALLGPLVFFALWPWLWRDTFARLHAYAVFHLDHVYYNMEYFGRTYFEPPMPRSYAFVMTAATVPVITLVLFAIGLGASLRACARGGAPSAGRPTTLLWLLALAVQYGAWLSPRTPIFGGTKHWMSVYPFLTLFAGVGAAAALGGARRLLGRAGRPPSRLASLVLGSAHLGAALLPPAVQALHAHPWALSSYNVLVGGAAGAATLGLNRGFWGYQTGALTGYLAGVPRGATVFLHDTAWQAWQMLVRDGRVRRDLRPTLQIGEADVALYHHEQHMAGVEYQIWVAFGTTAPDAVAGLDGVPVVWTYRRR
jgi:4-amino-4-deoxy-L-arabinose transferase-like glycosyltransferase